MVYPSKNDKKREHMLLAANTPLNLTPVIAGEKNIVVDAGETIEFISMTTSYHSYYEMHTYKLKCLFKANEYTMSCSMYKGGNQPKIDCVEGNLFKGVQYFWKDVFTKEFPFEK